MYSGKFIDRKIKVITNVRIYVTNRTRSILHHVVSLHNGHPNNFQNLAPWLKMLTIIDLIMRKQLGNLVLEIKIIFCRIGITVKQKYCQQGML